MESEFKKAINFYYRHLLFVEGKNYLDKALEYIKIFLKVNPQPKITYAFHPWVSGSKDRLNFFKQNINLPIVDIDYSSSERYLGETFDLVILDAVDDFRPNYISRLVDMTRGGGLAVIYTDNLYQNKLYRNSLIKDGIVDSYFEDRFLRKVKSYPGIIYVKDGKESSFKSVNEKSLSRPKPKIPQNPTIPLSLHNLCLSEDQNKALEESTFILQEKKRVLAITAPRGRGKSAVVGLFLSYVVKRRLREPTVIIVTSPSYFSSFEIFKFLIKGLEALGIKHRVTKSKDGKIMRVSAGEVIVRWLAPDLAKDYEGYLIVVDEAAAIGTETLEYIVNSWNKVVLISTIHGYEGSGKAFLKYLMSLKQRVIFKHVTLDFPIRYAKGDPVERFIYDVMLLDAEPKERKYTGIFREISREELFKNDAELRQIYGILVSAHYRNSPDDLMLLGDLHFQKIFSIDDIGVAQIVYEGGLSEEKVRNLMLGEGSLGNLIPHRIIKYERVSEFGKLRGWRVVRIAVLPEYQGKGIGSNLLSEIKKEAEKEGLDWIGSSFVMDYKVLNFWVKNGFYPVYLASRKNEGLNGYSVIVLYSFNEETKRIVDQLSFKLKTKILKTAHQVYFNVSPITLAKLLASIPAHKKVEDLDSYYIEKIKAFLEGILPYNSVADAIYILTEKYFWERPINLDVIEEATLVGRVLQGKSWSHIAYALNKTPREVEEILLSSVSKLMKAFI